LGQRTVLLSLAEPRASEQACWLADQGFEVLNAALLLLESLGDSANALNSWITKLDPHLDVLLPVSPGAIACLAKGLQNACFDQQQLRSMAWLCLGEGSLDALHRHFPTDEPHALRRLGGLRQRDLASLMKDPSTREWIGSRRLHLLCAQDRVEALQSLYPPHGSPPVSVHAVYRECWIDWQTERWSQLLQALATTQNLAWQIGSVALLERWQQVLDQNKQSAIESADRSTSCLLSHATSALVKAHLFAPHERIIDRARALGYCGESRVVAGKQAFLGALALA